MSAIMGCPCYQGENLKVGGLEQEGFGLTQALRARPSGKVHSVNSLLYCESVAWYCVGEVLYYIVYHKQM